MEQSDLAKYVVSGLERLQICYAVVGSYGSMAYGEARMTRDVDILIDFAQDQVADFCRLFNPPNWYISETAVRDAIRRHGQFNALHSTTGDKFDFMLPTDNEWGRTQLSRRQRVGLTGGIVGYAAAPEDIILGKLLYYKEGGSDKHLRDIGGMLILPGSTVDREQVAKWAEQLQVTEEWRKVLERVKTKPIVEGNKDP
jgi:hypothetical protein